MLANETDHFAHTLVRHAELAGENVFKFLENRLTNEKLVLGKHELQDVVTEPAGREGRNQDVGVQKSMHGVLRSCLTYAEGSQRHHNSLYFS